MLTVAQRLPRFAPQLAAFAAVRTKTVVPAIHQWAFVPQKRTCAHTTEAHQDLGATSHKHFRRSNRPHPLSFKPIPDEYFAEDKFGRNHIWSKEDISDKMHTLYRHKPQSISDKAMHVLMYGLYNGFNKMTGFDPKNPSARSCEWRLIVLESFAGVPGFVAAAFRHFRSLRRLQRDHGWINTLLEEAENERMHLLICLKMFKAGIITRFLVIGAQVTMTPFLMLLYTVYPKALHRFVGYLEETACFTYRQIIHCIKTEGTHLNKAWGQMPAPPIARGYYNLPTDAKWVDALEQIFADESHHRDINHTFATMKSDDPNPFVVKHLEDAAKAWRLEHEPLKEASYATHVSK